MTMACDAVGLSYRAVFDWREADPEFAKEWLDTVDKSTEVMEAEAYRRAFQGHDTGVYHQGVLVATEKKHSDTLMIFMLKGRRPDKYRERSEVDIRASVAASGDAALEAVASASGSCDSVSSEDEDGLS